MRNFDDRAARTDAAETADEDRLTTGTAGRHVAVQSRHPAQRRAIDRDPTTSFSLSAGQVLRLARYVSVPRATATNSPRLRDALQQATTPSPDTRRRTREHS